MVTNICAHQISYSKCAKCKGKQVETNKLWLLDSGASFHFTNKIEDFAKYNPLKKPVLVSTATSTTGIIDVGTVILNHESGIVQLAPVYYIPDLNCRLISMGTLLRDGMIAYGNSKCVKILTESKQVFLKFRPRKDGDTIYCIRSLLKNE
jgi:hypothetical protein